MEKYKNPSEAIEYRSVRIHPEIYRRIREVAYQREITIIESVKLMVEAYDDANGK